MFTLTDFEVKHLFFVGCCFTTTSNFFNFVEVINYTYSNFINKVFISNYFINELLITNILLIIKV
jgi:hypothetical protein